MTMAVTQSVSSLIVIRLGRAEAETVLLSDVF